MANPFPSVIVDGQPRYLACLPPREDFGGFRSFASANDLISRDQWRDIDLASRPDRDNNPVPVWDQGQHGSCVGHGSAMAFLLAFITEGGTIPPGGFSPTSLYAPINGGRDGGAIVSDAMTALIEVGIALMAQYPEQVIHDRDLPPGVLPAVQAARKRFRVLDAFHCGTFDAIGSALQLGLPVSFGITIRSGFNQPRSDGYVAPGGMVLGGHCLCGKGTTRLADGRWAIRVRNSWGTRWGLRGDCLLVEDHFGRDCDAFAIRADASDPQEPRPRPAIVA